MVILDKFIEKLKSEIVFKDDTNIGDSVLVIIQGDQMAPNTIMQGLVTDIERDIKPGWWVVTIIFLFPPKRIRWQLKHEYFTGQNTFTMNGTPMWIAAVQDLKSQDLKSSVSKPEKRKLFTVINGGKHQKEIEPEVG
jgi:hypothetical protein